MYIVSPKEYRTLTTAYHEANDEQHFINLIRIAGNQYLYFTGEMLSNLYSLTEKVNVSELFAVYYVTPQESVQVGRDKDGLYELEESGSGLTDWKFTDKDLIDIEHQLGITEMGYYTNRVYDPDGIVTDLMG